MKTCHYLYINIALVIGLVISRVFFHGSVLEKFFEFAFGITMTLSVIWEAYWVHRLERIKNSKNAYFKNNSQIAEDITDWQKHCKSLVNKFWDYILVFPLLIYFMLSLQWAEFIALIAYQAIKAIVAWEIKEINGAYVKFRKDEMVANIKEETVQAFVGDIEQEKVEA